MIRLRDHQRGFTIIELLIATSVLSVLLMIISAVLLGIGNLYYKGINLTRAQQNVRFISDDIGQQLEYSDSDPVMDTSYDNNGAWPKPVNVLCAGNIRYTFVTGTQLGTDTNQIPHVLWRQTNIPQASCFQNVPDLWGNSNLGTGTEMIAPNSRLTALNVDPNQTPYEVQVGVAYGDDDLLDSNSGGLDTRCISGAGEQYCATAYLVTNVLRRI